MSGRLEVADALHHARQAVAAGPPAVSVVVLESSDGGPAAGERMVVWVAEHAGTLGSAALDAAAIEAARSRLPPSAPAGTQVLEAEGLRCTVYLEPHRPRPELVIVGAGHIARPLCRVGALLGFRVVVLDDRPEFATRERFPEAA
ncbi:MAG TPA: XdhC family protein, partial [Longimicrobium sp.]